MGLCVKRAQSDAGHRAGPFRRRTTANRKPPKQENGGTEQFQSISTLLVLEYAFLLSAGTRAKTAPSECFNL